MFRRRRPQTSDPPQPTMITIPAGPFWMGTAPQEIREVHRLARGNRLEWFKRELPAHQVALPDFQLGRYPVTVKEFSVFVEAGGYAQESLWSTAGWQWRTRSQVTHPEYWGHAKWSGRPDFPVVGVSWYAAAAYCMWLQSQTGLPYRLPSEAEWEKAARGPAGCRYPWGNHWEPTYCNTAHETDETWDSWDSPAPARQDQLLPVGGFSPQGDSPYGCADMAGNIWEWCYSTLQRYPLPAQALALLPDNSEPRVVRGGSWYHGPDDARCAARYCYYPHGRDNVVGFRLALSR